MGRYLIILFLIFLNKSFSQKTHTKSITVFWENDNNVPLQIDQYYTNGIKITYRNLIKHNNYIKKTRVFGLEHNIYTPFLPYQKRYYTLKEENRLDDFYDRSFAGTVSFNYGMSYFKEKYIFKYIFKVGVLGPLAYGGELQNWFHRVTFHFKTSGWDKEIDNTPLVQTDFFLIKRIFSLNDKIDLSMASNLQIGTVWNNVSIGALFRIGVKMLKPLKDSSIFNGELGVNGTESFFYLIPRCYLKIYDATLTGSIFEEQTEYKQTLNPIYFTLDIGHKYRKNRWVFDYAAIVTSTENLNENIRNHQYGRVTLTYLFK